MAHISRSVYPMLKTLSLKGVRKLTFTFDPFHPRVLSIRDFLFLTSAPKILDTNLDVSLKVNIKSDRSDPIFDVTFNDDTKAIFKTKNLMVEDILSRFHKMCDDRNPKEEESALPKMTKASKKRK